jgi:hypothetical protein
MGAPGWTMAWSFPAALLFGATRVGWMVFGEDAEN